MVNIETLNPLPFLHVVVCPFQFPEVGHVLELDPSLEYPELHVKSALVSTGYLPFTEDLLYSTLPFDTLNDPQVTENYFDNTNDIFHF